jgi:hypothetical protein
MGGPLARVRAAFAAGRARSVGELAAAAGLPRDVVAAALEHLLATGQLQADALRSGCPPESCQACALARRGCPAAGPGRGRLLTLRRTPEAVC